MKTTSSLRRITLLLNETEGMHAGLVRGVGQYMRATRGWVVHRRNANLRQWERVTSRTADGILGCLLDDSLNEAVAELHIPVVNLCGKRGCCDAPLVQLDYHAAAAEMCRHLVERGHRHLALFGPRSIEGTEAMRVTMEEIAGEHGLSSTFLNRDELRDSTPYEAWNQAMEDWLCALPKPVGIVTALSLDAVSILQCAHRRTLDVPWQVAVVTVPTEGVCLDLAYPTLSQVDVRWSRLGYEAARLLDGILDGDDIREPTPMVPTGLIIARSSDAVATGDTQVSEALRYIREHAAQPLAVAEVASSAHLSRRVLEKRFRRQLGRSVFDEIRDQQIAHVRVLLLDTNLPLEEVCARSAFANVSHMTSAFRKRVGLAPGHFRKQEPAPFL